LHHDHFLLEVRSLVRLHVNVSFELGHGECVTLQGSSGSGKTLLLRAIADLDPNEGTVLLEGAPRESMPAPLWRRQVTFVAAEPGWWGDTVGEHFAAWEEARPLVEELGLPATCAEWTIQRLSTGERQRLGLARALALRSRVLLLDEPTSGLDADAMAAVESIIAKRTKAGTGVIWVTHNAEQARRIASRRFILEDGRMTEERT
jgi:UDP-glucose/iron transport system ATP-binding protein